MKFHLNSFNGCQLTERTRNSIANDQKEITPKISKAELWFLCMTHCLIVLYNCMKFHLNSFNGCQLTERTRNSIANDQREITPTRFDVYETLCPQQMLVHKGGQIKNWSGECKDIIPTKLQCQTIQRTLQSPNLQREIIQKK